MYIIYTIWTLHFIHEDEGKEGAAGGRREGTVKGVTLLYLPNQAALTPFPAPHHLPSCSSTKPQATPEPDPIPGQ